jgi:L-ascorbate metabolism protein UlaG (beta-lactamase superfamily)
LKNIDAVVISNDHFDHLDMDTIQALARGGTHFFVGLGIGAHLERWGVPTGQVHDMDWWERAELPGVTIHCAPARQLHVVVLVDAQGPESLRVLQW